MITVQLIFLLILRYINVRAIHHQSTADDFGSNILQNYRTSNAYVTRVSRGEVRKDLYNKGKE